MFKKSVVGKTFILVMPSDFGIYEVFNDNIRHFGFNLISIVPDEFKYIDRKSRIINFFYKSFRNDRSYKKKLIEQYYSKSTFEKIRNFHDNSADYVLIIRPDLLNTETVNKLLLIGKKVIAYQWDGLDRFPKVFDNIKLFSSFLVFDQNDYNKYYTRFPNIVKSENFYFDYDGNGENKRNSKTVYYIGSYYADRSADLVFIIKELENYNLVFDVNLRYHPKTNPLQEKNIKFFRESVNFAENINRVKNSKIILDFKVSEHDGLSLRFFEALKYQKKIITNNKTILDFDFYDPQNIFVLHHDDITRLDEFINSDYKSVPCEIVDQYSFSTWLNNYVV